MLRMLPHREHDDFEVGGNTCLTVWRKSESRPRGSGFPRQPCTSLDFRFTTDLPHQQITSRCHRAGCGPPRLSTST